MPLSRQTYQCPARRPPLNSWQVYFYRAAPWIVDPIPTDDLLETLLAVSLSGINPHVEGTGAGLYIVRKMVENAGSKIEVESRVGEGSVFRVYFRQ